MSSSKKSTTNNDKTGNIFSWVLVIVLMFVVPPIGWICLFIKLGIFSGKKIKANKMKVKRSRLDKKTGKGLSVFLLLIAIALVITGFSVTIGALTSGAIGTFSGIAELSLGGLYLLGGIISFFSRNIVAHRFSRYKNYNAFIDDRGIVPIYELMQISGFSQKIVVRDINAMINNGYLVPGAYIDNELKCLVLSSEAARKLRDEIKGTSDDLSNVIDSNQTSSQAGEVPVNQYAAYLAELREAKSFIKDDVISGKVNRLEELTEKIFKIVEDTPQKQPQIRRFMNYYSPTTLKLIRSYTTLENQGVKGENIMSAKKNIGNILDTLITGYEQQLDQLFKSDAIDIAADISVLENLMVQDGLTGAASEFQVAVSN